MKRKCVQKEKVVSCSDECANAENEERLPWYRRIYEFVKMTFPLNLFLVLLVIAICGVVLFNVTAKEEVRQGFTDSGDYYVYRFSDYIGLPPKETYKTYEVLELDGVLYYLDGERLVKIESTLSKEKE